MRTVVSETGCKRSRMRLGRASLVRDRAIVNRIMTSIRSEGGRADKALGSALWRRGLRYRRRSRLIGKPDLVFARAGVVVFVDGDFWHGRYLDERIARGDFKRNADYWIPKLQRTVERDRRITAQLIEDGWLVLRFWESRVNQDVDSAAEEVVAVVRSRMIGRKSSHKTTRKKGS